MTDLSFIPARSLTDRAVDRGVIPTGKVRSVSLDFIGDPTPTDHWSFDSAKHAAQQAVNRAKRRGPRPLTPPSGLGKTRAELHDLASKLEELGVDYHTAMSIVGLK